MVKTRKTTTMKGKGQNANNSGPKPTSGDAPVKSKKGVKKGKFYPQAFESAKRKIFKMGKKKY